MEEMSREGALSLLRKAAELGARDPERAHEEADDVLCALLRSLGYGDVVDEWGKVEKWFA